MATTNQKRLEFERLKSLVNEGQPYEALKDLSKLAKKNKLVTELEKIGKIKENLQFLDAHLEANSMEPMFARTKRNEVVFELLDFIDGLQEREDLSVTFQGKKEVNLLLDKSVGLTEEKRLAIVKTLGKILGVNSDNIDIEQVAGR
jgi:hypothetical protein